MTKEQKIDWAENASNKELIEQIRRSAQGMQHGSIADMIEATDDYYLVVAELLKRLGE